jgi:vacuolar-type H+-ATPase subunit H
VVTDGRLRLGEIAHVAEETADGRAQDMQDTQARQRCERRRDRIRTSARRRKSRRRDG